MGDMRVRRGYTVHMRKQVFNEGSLIENITDEEAKEHSIRLEPAEHEAMRQAITPEQAAARDHEQRMEAEAKYAKLYERTIQQVAADLVKLNPPLAAEVTRQWTDKQAKEAQAAFEQTVPASTEPVNEVKEDGITKLPEAAAQIAENAQKLEEVLTPKDAKKKK